MASLSAHLAMHSALPDLTEGARSLMARKDIMEAKETRQETLSRVATELGTMIRKNARARWDTVRTAERDQGNRHVWRFRFGSEPTDRFLHVHHRAMTEESDAAQMLATQLKKAHWLDRIESGPETSFVLSPAGRLRPWPKA